MSVMEEEIVPQVIDGNILINLEGVLLPLFLTFFKFYVIINYKRSDVNA